MATRNLPRSLLTSKQSRAAMFSHSPLSQPSGKFAASASASPVPRSSSFLYRLRPLVAAAAPSRFRCLFPGISARAFSTPPTTSSLNDENPNWSDLPPIEPADLPEGCDLEHWLAIMDPPEGDPTRDEIIDGYIKTLAKVVGSEEEARMKIYSLSRYNFAFGALVSEELWDLPKVRLVLPDSYLDVENKIRIMEAAVPYDIKYQKEWLRKLRKLEEVREASQMHLIPVLPEEEARMKIYSLSRNNFAFGALVSEELSFKLWDLPKVCLVLPDSYLDVENKDYGGVPFINGQAAFPYDTKYQKEFLRKLRKLKEVGCTIRDPPNASDSGSSVSQSLLLFNLHSSFSPM